MVGKGAIVSTLRKKAVLEQVIWPEDNCRGLFQALRIDAVRKIAADIVGRCQGR